MKKMTFWGVLVAVFLVLPVYAQDQSGSVAIAGAIRAKDEVTLTAEFAGCVASLKESGVAVDAAVKACTEIARVAAKTATKIANEAADATKASRPIVMVRDRYGYGGRYYSGSRWGFNWSYRSRSYRRNRR